MARELRRLLIEPARLAAAAAAGALALEAEESRYLGRVLRYGPGDRFAVTDGAGGLWSAELLERGLARLEQPLDAPLERQPAPAPLLELAVALPKRDVDTLVRMACELGIDRLQPLASERGSARGEGRAERWQAILREACEQCERLWLPELASPAAAIEWLAQRPQGPRLLAVTRDPQAPPLGEVLAGLPPAPALAASIRLAIGPEGGWSPAEEDLARSAGWQPVSLGPWILRTATAALAGASLLAQWRELSCPEGCRRSP
jgi:16S rRNA (uracil1498-N3)-methyltransferase